MVFFYVSKHVTKWIGPPMFRNGLRLRNRLSPPQKPGVGTANNNYWVDMACMIPYSQKLLSLTVYDESKRLAAEFRKQHQKEQQEASKPLSKAEETMAVISMMTDPVATSKLSDLRVDVLDSFLRPALIPNDRWSDIEDNWRYNLRIVAWARKEFLIGKYGPYIQEAMVAYPKLRNSPQLSFMTSGNRRQLLLDLVHRGQINTDNIGGGIPEKESPFLRLPTTETILSAFRMEEWSSQKRAERVGQSLVPIANNLGGSIVSRPAGGAGSTNHVDVPKDTNVDSTGLEDILEVVTRGYVKNCGPLNALCQEANFYQLYSREYIQHLGDYLLKRTAMRRMDVEQQAPQTADHELLNETAVVSSDTIVIDIGAGDGLLMHCLRDYMERKVMGLPMTDVKKGKKKRGKSSGGSKNKSNRQGVIPTMVATDDMSWRIFAKAQVEKLSVEQALEKYASNHTDPSSPDDDSKQRPQVIVICSWMPMGQDWTSQFRKANVDEYILIGEADDGSCGDNWLTWGNPAFYDQSAGIKTSSDHDEESNFFDSEGNPSPLYAKEGYQRMDMDPLTNYQFSSFDLANSKSSKTVSFRKRKQKR